MRIVLDFQACQSASRYRGIGRGSRSLQLAMANLLMSSGHQVIFLLNEAFKQEFTEVSADILKNAPGARISSFRIPSLCAAAFPENAWRQIAARVLREHAIACLEPDFVHVPALLADGWSDDSISSVGMIGTHIPTALTQHDLIPLAMSDTYMPSGPFKDYYMKKLESVKRADLLLAISEYSRLEAINWLGVPAEDIVHISSAADRMFTQQASTQCEVELTVSNLAIRKGFLLYAPGGFDPRKNIDRLLDAYSRLPIQVRTCHQLVIASKLHEGVQANIESKAAALGLRSEEIVLTDYLSDGDLMNLYGACHAYVFPSLHEGFGLPALEAMSCGAPVIASNRTSIPEVIEMEEAYFDPYNPQSIAEKIMQVISDPDFRKRLILHTTIQPHKFSWEASAELAVTALERKHAALRKSGWRSTPCAMLPSHEEMLAQIKDEVKDVQPNEEDLQSFYDCLIANRKAADT